MPSYNVPVSDDSKTGLNIKSAMVQRSEKISETNDKCKKKMNRICVLTTSGWLVFAAILIATSVKFTIMSDWSACSNNLIIYKQQTLC